MVGKIEKLAIVTRAYGINEMSKISHPLISEYAKKCNADFIVINQRKINIGPFHNEIYQCYDLFDEYDRILQIDSDTLISSKCPNIFDEVPYECIGVVYEDKGSRARDRHNRIQKAQSQFGNIGWSTGYINNGVFLASKIHREIFQSIDGDYYNDYGYDDVHIGYQIRKNKFLVKELGFQFNHISLFSENGSNWLKSYVIHYAGKGFYRNMPRNKQMERDLSLISSDNSFLLNFVNIIPRLRLFALGIVGYLIEYRKNAN